MHILIKFFSQKSYLREFVSGKLYMNSLDYFWNNGFYEQKDIFEGVVCTVPVKDFNEMPLDFQAVQASDYHFRADGYRFCNVLCFYKVGLTQIGKIFRYNLNPAMSQFGDYVAIITNEAEFLKRIETAVRNTNYQVLCGDVHYHPQMINGIQSNPGPCMYLEAKEEKFTIEELQGKGFGIRKRDCFDKDSRYMNQREWRIALYRGHKCADAYELDVGNLSDIIRCCNAANIQNDIDNCLRLHMYSNIEGWYGTASRSEMRELFYHLGNNKTTLFSVIG